MQGFTDHATLDMNAMHEQGFRENEHWHLRNDIKLLVDIFQRGFHRALCPADPKSSRSPSVSSPFTLGLPSSPIISLHNKTCSMIQPSRDVACAMLRCSSSRLVTR